MDKQRILLLVILLLVVIGGITGISLWKVQKDQTQKINTLYNDINVFNAQKDTLTKNLAEATNFISDVYVKVTNIAGEVAVSNSLEKIDNLDYKAQIASKLQDISAMVDSYKAQMQTAEEQIAQMKKQNAALAGQVKVLEETIVRLKDITIKQQERINLLVEELEMTKAEREKYKTQAIEAARALFETKERLNTGYYIVGTIDELKAKGVIEKKGNVLFLGGAWQPVPGIGDSLNLTQLFTKINIEKDKTVPLPFQSYKLVSPHNSNLTKLQAGEVGGSAYKLQIAKPDQFWSQSKFLIIAEW